MYIYTYIYFFIYIYIDIYMLYMLAAAAGLMPRLSG